MAPAQVKDGDDHVRLIVQEELKACQVQTIPVCKEKHKEVATLKTMIWGIILLLFTILGGVLTTLIQVSKTVAAVAH